MVKCYMSCGRGWAEQFWPLWSYGAVIRQNFNPRITTAFISVVIAQTACSLLHYIGVLYVAHRVFVRTNCSDYGGSRAAQHYPALVMGGRGAVYQQ